MNFVIIDNIPNSAYRKPRGAFIGQKVAPMWFRIYPALYV